MEEGITPAGVQVEKETEMSSGSCIPMIWSGDADALERHGIKEMLGLIG